MNDKTDHKRETLRESDRLKHTARQKSTGENLDGEQAERHQQNFSSFSDGMPAVDRFGLVMGDGSTLLADKSTDPPSPTII